jgi:hypothetical protein
MPINASRGAVSWTPPTKSLAVKICTIPASTCVSPDQQFAAQPGRATGDEILDTLAAYCGRINDSRH